MSALRPLFSALADALEAFARGGEKLRKAAHAAIYNAEQPCDEPEVVEKVAALALAASRIADAYEALAQKIDADHEGAVDPLGYGVPVKSAGLRLEARVAALMGRDWQLSAASAYANLAEELPSEE